ncbi:Titin isoform N2B [Phytophthora megakarya]|uniref:Titin isoform N2B n=1 Tax=Phytophthora megakarya TaxID=4795 RepID=A0A225X0J1_9STRA|nr:Titin isoform N2B [Phytophthora megakarya]
MALEELTMVDSVGVSRSAYSAAKNGYVYTVTFDGAYLVSGEQTNVLTGDTTGCQATQPPNRKLTFQGARVTTGVAGFYPEVWQIVSTNTGAQVLGGTFDLSVGFEGDWVDAKPGTKVDIAAGSRMAKTTSSMLGFVNRGDRVRIGGEDFKVHATAQFTDSQLPLDSYHVHGATGASIEVMDTALGTVQVTHGLATVTYSGDFTTSTPSIAGGELIRIGTKSVQVLTAGAGTLTLVSAWSGDTALHVTAFARKKTTMSASVDAVEMKRALSALPGVGSIEVTRHGPTSLNGYHWYVTFQSLNSVSLRVDKTLGNAQFIDVYGDDCTTCTVTASVVMDDTQVAALTEIEGGYATSAIVASQEVSGVVDEVQTITTSATTNDISGSFTASFQSVGGAVINFDDTAADVRFKLQNIATVGRLNVTRTENANFGATWAITFLSNLGDLPLLVITDRTLLKGTGVNVVIQEIVKGVDIAFETIIDGLVPGHYYYVRAFARNENGYGLSTTNLQQRGRGALPLLTSVSMSPDPPGITGMWPLSGSQMELRLSSPVDHGDPVSKYLFEYAVGDTFGTVATKKLSIFDYLENDIAGTFRLQYGDDVTTMLPVHTTSASLQTALNSLPSMRPVSVTRAVYVLTGEATSQVTKFVVSSNSLITTTLTDTQCKLLVKGSRIDVGGKIFTVKLQPTEGSTGIDVDLGHGVLYDITTANLALLKLDKSGSERGPYGYSWTISFDNDAGDVVHGEYPGLQLVPSLTSVYTSMDLSLTNCGITVGQTAMPADHYGYFEINNDESVCDTYVVGASSSVQVIRLFGPTTVTDGAFKLKLGSEITDCIALGKVGAPSSMKVSLEALKFVSKVTVEEVRTFKVAVLSGSTTSKVTDYDGSNLLTVVSTDTTAPQPGGLTNAEIKILLQRAIIRVSRNPNDFSRHSCEFRINTTPSVGDTQISVTAIGPCSRFTGESRSLKLLDFHDYNVHFWGHYPTGKWPTLQFDSTTFGKSLCTPWEPQNVQVYGQIHTVKYEGVCSQGQSGIQTILADGSSIMGGTFTLSYMGKVTSPLSFQTTGAAEMADAIDSITAPGTVSVSVSQYGVYGKAWHVTFVEIQDEDQDSIFIQHSRLTGQSALISVYPTVTVFTDAKQNDISGSFRIAISGETTEAIGYSATHMKVTQELQKLTVVDSVVALGDVNAGDVGVYALALTADATGGKPTLSNIKLDGKSIDPTKFLAIGETLTVGTDPVNTIKSVTPVDITMTKPLQGTAPTANFNVFAGLITKQTKSLPGYVGISPLMQVIAVTNGGKDFQLPADNGFTSGSKFFIGDTMFTVQGLPGTTITTDKTYLGESVVAGYPKVFIFDNKLLTTEDLRNLVVVGDNLWLPSVSADMSRYVVTAVDARFLAVAGSFTDRISRRRAYHVSNGHKWNLVFRSYDGSLDTVDAIPEHDWRGTDARIGTRSPKGVSPNVINVGNPASAQTILLEVADPTIVTTAYTLSFAGETVMKTVNTPKTFVWTTINDDIKKALETLDSVDGVSVTSVVRGGSVIHSISFWGTYPMKKLPLLVIAPVNGNLNAYVQDNDAVAVTKQDNLILESSQDYAFRVFAENSRGTSDSVSIFQAQTSASSVVPTPPTGVSLGEFHGPTWLSINYWAPFYTGGAKVTMYRIEWDSSPTFDSSSIDYGVASIQEKIEVQQVTTSYRSSIAAGGTFTLSWGGHTTSALRFDCSAADMTDAIALITDTSNVAVDPVKVTRARASWGFTWKITFLHNPGDLALLVADGTQLTGDFPQIRVAEIVQGFRDLAIGDFTHEVQEVFTDGVSSLGGWFTLTFSGQTTGTINFDASALELQTALQATTTLYTIKVTKVIRNAAVNAAVWSVTFAYLRGEEMVGAGNILTMSANSYLTGTSAVVQVANKITGTDPFRFSLTGLRPGVRYYAHVMAYNEDGFGSATSPLASAVTCGQPQPPQSVVATVVSGTTLAVSWSASAVDGDSCSVDKYKVEWYRAEGTQEQQTITTSAGKGLPEIQRLVNFADSRTLSGYFKLTFGGESTGNLRWDAPATGLNSVKDRLERLSTIGTVDVSREESTRVTGLFVTVTGKIVTRHSLSTSTVVDTGLTKDDIIWIGGNQRTITAAVVAGTTTLAIDADLEVSVPIPVFKSAYGYQWTITFLAGHIGPQEIIQVAPSDSWTGNNPGIVVDSVQKGLQPISGTFRAAFASGGVSDTTPPLPHNISATDLQTALENLITIGAVNVTRSANGYGYNWVVTFLSEVKSDISMLVVDGTELQGPGARVLAARTLAGSLPSFYCEQNGVAGPAAEVTLPGKLRYVMQGLKTGQQYAIRVRGHNSEGYGYVANISPAQIPRSTPSVPQNVELLVLSSKYIKLRWSAPASDGGSVVLGYRLQWDTASTFPNVNTPNYDFQTVFNVRSTDTGPYFYNIFTPVVMTYYVRVLALNDQGDGPYAAPTPKYARPIDRTPGRPENATATVLSSYAILVEWEASSTDKFYYGGDGGLPITQYMIEWDTSPAFNSPASFGFVAGTKRSFIIGGDDAITGVRSDILTAGMSYSIRVTAFNGKGSGAPQPTVPSSVVVTNQPPSAPQNLTLSVVSATSVKAEWTNPLFDGGSSLKSYQIEWDEQEDFGSGHTSSTTIPIVREIQSVLLESDVVNEEQLVDVTVEVVNEEQEVRSTFTGVDEIQVIKTTNDVVQDEIQQVVTSAADVNEIQELNLDDDDIDEIQAIRTTVAEKSEVHDVKVGVDRVNEIQSITLFFAGGFGNLASIGGTFFITFDSTACTYCLETTRHSKSTVEDLVALSLKQSDDVTAAGEVKTALENLDNIDTVTVSRTSTPSTQPGTTGDDITYVYLITFTGNDVGGDVPPLVVGGTISFGGNPITPTVHQETQGNEPSFDSASVVAGQPPTYSNIALTYTCESYSDPNAASTFSDVCTPTDKVCDSCVTDFSGLAFTVTGDVTNKVRTETNLTAGVCSFQVHTVTYTTGTGKTTIIVDSDDPGALCSEFSSATFSLFMTPQITISSFPVKTSATAAISASDFQAKLNVTGLIDAMTVERNFAITSDFVGAIYSVSFTTRSGKIPLLSCDTTKMSSIQPGKNVYCLVTRKSTGSMLSGTFKIGLVSQDDTDPTNVNKAYTPTTLYKYSVAIPWDATEAVVESTLKNVDILYGKLIFGTLKVTRTAYYSPTAVKWSGGFSWQITFTTRGNVAGQIVIGDGANPLLNPTVACRQGNQIGGTMTFTFGSALLKTCTIGVDTSLDTLDHSVTDTNFQDFFKNSLNVPTIKILRSAASQARGFTWTIEFIDDSTPGDVPDLSFTTQLTSTIGSNNGRTNVVELRKGNEVAGSFQLVFNQESTGPIMAGADELAVQAQLNSLRTIKPSSVIVHRTLTDPQAKGYTWLITFRSSVWADPTLDHSAGIDGNWKGAAAAWDDVWESGFSKAWGRHVGQTFPLTCDTSSLVTTNNDHTQTCVASVVVGNPGVNPLGGTFSIIFDTSTSPHMAVQSKVTSDDIAHNAFATKEESGHSGTSVEEILEKMANVGDVEVSRGIVNQNTGGYEWTVTFLRDASDPIHSHRCEEMETLADGSKACNSPGNVPQMTTDETKLMGSTNRHATVTTFQDGVILRGDFTDFKVPGDAGIAQQYTVSVNCLSTPCTVTAFKIESGSSTIRTSLLPSDRFIVGGITSCVFEVVDVDTGITPPTKITVKSLACGGLSSGINSPLGLSILIPWNGDEDLVRRVLEAASTTPGRKVSVQKTVIGKYGEMSWHVHFISNPSYTPLGAGNLPKIVPTFLSETVLNSNPISVNEITPGSEGLSGSFFIDFHSSFGPREIAFDEDAVHLERKLNEMDTIGRVSVERSEYPSAVTGCTDSLCSGGWEGLPVGNPGTRGGYRWRIRFLRVTGEHEGVTFPPGSGNLDEFTADYLTSLNGDSATVVPYANTAGSSPILGSFALSTAIAQTPSLLYTSTAEAMKQGIEAMDLFGDVDVTQGYLLTQKIPGVTAKVARDSRTATINGVKDIRQFISPTDIIRFGSSSAENLVGSDGDTPFTTSNQSSIVTVGALSPIVVAADLSSTKLLYPGMKLRIDGLPYDVQRSGYEIQTISVSIPTTLWATKQSIDSYALTFSRAGVIYGPTNCIAVNADADTVHSTLISLIRVLDPLAPSKDILVSRSGSVTTTATSTGYVYSVYFFGDSVAGDVATLQQATTGVSCTDVSEVTVVFDVVTQGGNLPHQRLSLATDSGQVIDSNGYYKMSLNGKETDCMIWGAAASDLEDALENKLNTGKVIVTRRGGGISQTEIQRLTMTADSEVTSDSRGLFQLQLTYAGVTAATDCISYGISDTNLQKNLNSLSNLNIAVDHINVTRQGDGSSTWGFGYEYLINFRGPLAGGYSPVIGDVPLLEIVNIGQGRCSSTSVGGHPALIIETVRDGSPGYIYDIFFMDYTPAAIVPTISLQYKDQGLASVCSTGWIQNGGSVRRASIETIDSGGSSEIQVLTIRDTTAIGTFMLSFHGQTTSCLLFNAGASAVKDALNALSAIGGGVSVSGDKNVNLSPNGFVHRITFVGDLVTGNVPLLVVQEASVTCLNPQATTKAVVSLDTEGGQNSGAFALTSYYNGEAPAVPHVAYSISQQFSVMSEQFEIQQLLTLNPGSPAATYTLSIPGHTTNAIPWDASESVMEAELTAVLTAAAGDITVTRRKDQVLAPSPGYVYTIYFSGTSVAGNQPLLVKGSLTNFNPGGDVVVSSIREGIDGVSSFTQDTIPLAKPDNANIASQYLASASSLDMFKVNGFLWTIKFKSSLGNIPKLGKQAKALSGGTLTVVDDFIPGSASNSYVIPNLLPGITYYVHVASMTDIGMGLYSDAGWIVPSGTASAVQNIAAGYALYEREVQEIRLAATHINEIQEITTDAASIAEVQTLRTYASCPIGPCIKGGIAFRVPTVQTLTIAAQAVITQGTFTLLFTRQVKDTIHPGSFTIIGDKTAPISWNADAVAVKNALVSVVNGALAVDDIVVTRDGDASEEYGYGYVFQITFVGNSVAGETSKMVCGDKVFTTTGNVPSSCTVAINTDTAMGTDTAIQQIIVTAKKPLVAGSYSLIFDHLGASKTSSCIPFDASASVMGITLEAMPNIDKVHVTQERNSTVAPNGFIYHIIFHGNGVYGDVNVLDFVVCTDFQTQEKNALTNVDVEGKVLISMLDYGGFNTHNIFVDAATATAVQLTTDLGNLPVFGNVLVSQSLVDQQGGYVWTIAFNELEGNLPQFICAVDPVFKTVLGAACGTDTLTDGNVLSGTFVVEASSPIPFNADAGTMKAVLEAMSWIGTVQVQQSAPTPQLGYTWTITFLDYRGDVPTLLVTSSLVGTGSRISAAEVRKGNALGGTFALSYQKSTTTAISWDAPAMAAPSSNPDGSSMEEKLEALDVVGQVNVVRTGPDSEGGYTWLVTFLDNVLNSGDLPLLQGNASALAGKNAVVFTREVIKGSNAVGDQLWISFDPPDTNNGSPIMKYQVRWDTSADFTANPAYVFISDSDILYRKQRITTSALSLAWSNNMIHSTLDEIQQLTILTAGTFSLSFRGVRTGLLTAVAAGATTGATTIAGLKTKLEALSSVGTVDVSSSKTVLEVGAVILITFKVQPGNLPFLIVVPNPDNAASVVEIHAGTTNFRKEVIVFSCGATAGSVQFTYNGNDAVVDYNALLTDVETSILTLFGVEAGSISVTSGTQTVLCVDPTSTPANIKIVFDRVYGDISLTIDKGADGVSDANITPNADASIDGVFNYDPTHVMSGTFQVGYQGLYTRPLNGESTADQLRYALEDLDTIQTVGVVVERSCQPLPGTVDVTEGELFVTCSAQQTCNFYSAGYGLPGFLIRIGGDWYTVRTDLSSPGLHQSRLYLGDLNGKEIGYLGSTDTGVTVYEWTKGYVWTVDMLNVSSPLSYIYAKVPRLYPDDSTVRIAGAPCDKCYYIPNETSKSLIIGKKYYIEVYAYNVKGKVRAQNSQGFGGFQRSSPTKMQPYTTPSAPTQVALGITSATMLTVRWGPPSDDGGDTISGYVVQWDISAGFDSLALAMGTTVTVSDPAQRSYTIMGLTPGTLYYVRVLAKNSGGQGTPQTSTPSSFVPAVTYPGKPYNLTIAQTLVTGQLRVTWKAPMIPYHGYPCYGTLQAPESCPVVGIMNMVYGGVDLAQYRIQYSESNTFQPFTEVTTSSPSVVTVLLTGLDPSKTYYVQVQAQNARGLVSNFCKRADTQSLPCPEQQVLLDNTVVTGDYVYAQPLP